MALFKRVELNGVLAGYAQQVSPTSVATYPVDHPDIVAWLAAGNTPDPADPPPIVYSADLPIDGRIRTTDATATEVYRRTLASLTGYAAIVSLLGVDAGNGAVRMIRASIVAKRLNAGALLVGAPVVLANHADAQATTWAISASVSGNDVVIAVTGAAGRSIDWSLSGTVRAFAPSGMP